MVRSLSVGLQAFAVVILLTSPAAAATLHVATMGKDSNPGTLDRPLATPGRALSLAAAGDTILLRAGSYTITRTLEITQPGLTFRSYPGEHARIVAATDDLRQLTSVVLVYAGNVTVQDLELEGASYYGIKLDERYGPQSGNTVRRVYIHHTGRDGIKAQKADGVTIENCEVAFTGMRDTSNADGIDIMGSYGATVRHNYVHDVATTGIYVKAGTRDALIEANRVERTGHAGILLGHESGAEFMRDGALHEAFNSVARNNIIIAPTLAGLGSYSGDNVRFENNTVINAASGGQAAFLAMPNGYNTQPRNIVLKNNIFVLAPASTRPMVQLIDYSGPITSDSNLWFSDSGRYEFWRETSSGANDYWRSLDAWRSGTNADSRSRTVDPALDPAALYRPLAGSPAVDAGEALAGVVTDYAGVARPQGAACDIGAHEQATDAEPPSPPPPAEVPSSPTGLAAATPARATVLLTWTDTSRDEDGFRIERASAGGAFTLLATVTAGATSYTDKSVKSRSQYSYRVTAFNSVGASPYSNTATVMSR